MKLPKSWLCEYVDFNVSNEEFIERMMWRGFELAGIEKELPLEGVVVGKVLSIQKHENSDHLWVCELDVGTETLTIVTGAQNVSAGALVPVAVVGATLGERTMAKVTMRGVESSGMLCSGAELGLSEADYPGAGVDGILLLSGAHPLGQPIETALGFDDVIFEFDVTPNRPDCLSIRGMCREAAAALGQVFEAPEAKPLAGEGDAADYASVTIDNYSLCPRYTARVIKDIRIAPSPAWMQRRLRLVGLRPINNIVDITNYVLTEYGHPMHAFDLACVAGGHIIVRNANEGELVTTLDGKVRATTPDMLLIADSEKGVGIAGVMGGENSGITADTKAVLYESAVFKGSSIRATARKLRHMTDAAARFIKGVEPVNALKALERAVELTVELGAGTPVGDTIDAGHGDYAEQSVLIGTAHVNQMLGLSLSAAEMASMLATIQISAVPENGNLRLTIPHFRTDIETGIEADADIAEEIARIYGYYNIPPTLMQGGASAGYIPREFRVEDTIKDTLVANGAYEMYNYNFTGPQALEALQLDADDELRRAVRLLNPFGEDQSLMRTTLLPGMLSSLARNINRRTGQSRFFELANVHIDTGEELPEERKIVGITLHGALESFFALKGIIETLLETLGIENAVYSPGSKPYWQPGRAAQVHGANGKLIGCFGALHPDVAAAFDITERVYAAELSFAALLELSTEQKRFAPLPRYPISERDLAIVVDRAAESETYKRIIEQTKVDVLIESVRLFDSYEGIGIPPNKKSLAFSFSLRSDEHTLSDEEIRLAMNAIIQALEEAGAPLRA